MVFGASLVVVVVLLAAAPVSAKHGVDVSSTVSKTSAECLKSNGYSYLISRSWTSLESFDSASVTTYEHATAAGLEFDVYFFPCYGGRHPQCPLSSAASQMGHALGNMTKHGMKYGTLWIDVEEPYSKTDDFWSASHAHNQEFFEALVKKAQAGGAKVGVYTSKYMWELIMGSSYTGGSSFPLWYSHYDDKQSFSDFSAFGGWKTPHAKQYHGSTTVCSASVDLNWSP